MQSHSGNRRRQKGVAPALKERLLSITVTSPYAMNRTLADQMMNEYKP